MTLHKKSRTPLYNSVFLILIYLPRYATPVFLIALHTKYTGRPLAKTNCACTPCTGWVVHQDYVTWTPRSPYPTSRFIYVRCTTVLYILPRAPLLAWFPLYVVC